MFFVDFLAGAIIALFLQYFITKYIIPALKKK